MLKIHDEKLINECINDFVESNYDIDILKLKLKVWEHANLISENVEITKDIIDKILEDISILDNQKPVKYDWFLNKIVDSDMCAKCGTCSVVCPNNLIKFNEKPFISEECLRKGNGMCAEVCPRMMAGSYDIRNRLNTFEEFHYAKSDVDGQSGGVVTKFLQNLLEDNEIDGAVVIGHDKWKPASMIITSSEGLININKDVDTSKSKYAISSLQAIREAGELGLEKIAVVGLPCQVAGLRNIQYHSFISKHGPERGKNGKPAKLPKIEYVLGLFCTEKFEYDELVEKVDSLEISMDDIYKCDVKGKNFIISTKQKDYPISLSEIKASSGCLMCNDFDAELADISFGDKGSPDGFSTIVVRTPKGRIIEKYFDFNDEVNLADIDFMKSFKEKRFNKEVLRRQENDIYNSFYYIWKHAGVGSARNNRVYLRFRTTIGGYYNPELLMKISEVAKKYNAIIKLTSREEIEIQEIDLCDIENMIKEFDENDGLINGTEGPLFRSIMACPGKKNCNLGLIDTNILASEIEEKYAEKPLNYKFKLGITGCPNRCLAVSTTDFGINGVKIPQTADNCNGCGRCQDVCKMDAIEVRGDISITNYNLCVGCGKCINACPNEAKKIKFDGYSIFVGGKGGRETVIGSHFYVKDKIEIYQTLEAVMEVYNQLAIKPQKERLAQTIKRVSELYFFEKVDEYKKLNFN